MYLEKLAQVIEQEGVAEMGVNLFVHSAPAEVQNYVLLMVGGDGIPYDNELPGFYNTKYRVIIRHTSYEEGQNLAQETKEALTFYGKQIDNIIFKHSLPRDEPRPFRRNEAGIIEYSNNFLVSFVKQ